MTENYQGDLADILRASGIPSSSDSWKFTTVDDDDGDFHSGAVAAVDDPIEEFGDPFSNFRPDPLFINSTPSVDDNDDHREQQMMMNPSSNINNNNNIFSRMLQISPDHLSGSPSGSPATSAVAGKRVQISSPGNTGIKRRRSQAKKVVCIPAPTAININSTRSTGEVVPSDLWAWRKYGQKPIKGSPYPRGYYRCSSSKSCLARKQVERSRNDPNMLVITYTSEHNHAWPTQRNALAGSTRSQPNKMVGTTSKSKSSTCSKQPHKASSLTLINTKKEEDEKEQPMVKEEQMDGNDTTFGLDGFHHHHDDNSLMSNSNNNNYKPTLPDYSGHCDDLFGDLGEIDGDSIGLLFSQGYFGQEKGDNIINKGNTFDHFSSLFDWIDNKDKGGL
ncbi:probable WRKY transcription factor 35 [Impatiens glandulifera]|uniref:probable WRKY transcription factor 35 n=1 Tax=Impatiens glandulifera TaxID=253017 RepID=UPI001FB13F2F|nr:probable WRKY transcription factor 35 [Impatiens glandulifera]